MEEYSASLQNEWNFHIAIISSLSPDNSSITGPLKTVFYQVE